MNRPSEDVQTFLQLDPWVESQFLNHEWISSPTVPPNLSESASVSNAAAVEPVQMPVTLNALKFEEIASYLTIESHLLKKWFGFFHTYFLAKNDLPARPKIKALQGYEWVAQDILLFQMIAKYWFVDHKREKEIKKILSLQQNELKNKKLSDYQAVQLWSAHFDHFKAALSKKEIA